MHKLVPLIALVVATGFVGSAAVNLSNTAAVITSAPEPPPVVTVAPPAPVSPRQEPRPERPAEPPHKVLIRCLGDLDDILDTIRDPESFALVRPHLIGRMRQHVAEVADYPNPGMGQLSRAAAKELQAAINRHTESLTRASRVAPGVTDFFSKDIAAVLHPK